VTGGTIVCDVTDPLATPAGIEGFFEETLDSAPSDADDVPDNLEEVAARYAAAAPRYGMTFL